MPHMRLNRLTGMVGMVGILACGPAQSAGEPDLKAVAASMVKAGMVAPGDRVLISGSVRDQQLLHELLIESMKLGGQPLITLYSQQLGRRSYDEVPASFDKDPPTFDIALANATDVQLSVEVTETEGVMAGVPAVRMAARAEAAQPVNEIFLKRGVRLVNLGNGIYPTAAVAQRLGMSQAEVSAVFWKAASVPPQTLRAKGDALLAAMAGARELTLSSANGTQLRFGVTADKAFVSDGVITPEKLKRGGVSTQTWLPAGEVGVPAVAGSAEGRLVVDKFIFQGAPVIGLSLSFSKGRLTAMTAASGLAPLKAYYDASSGGKDQLSYLDLGVNPEARLPTNTGRVVWMAPGGIVIGLGDNTGWSGGNVSSFGLSLPVSGATLSADGKVLISNGVLQ